MRAARRLSNLSRGANALEAQLSAAEARRAEAAQSPDAMDLYFQGLAWMNKGVTPDNFRRRARCSTARSGSIPTTSRLSSAGPRWRPMPAGFFGPDDRLSLFASAEAALMKALSLAPATQPLTRRWVYCITSPWVEQPGDYANPIPTTGPAEVCFSTCVVLLRLR